MDHVGHAVPADRLDREIDVLQPEPVGGDLLQRKALGGELRQRELAGLVAVAASALDRDRLGRHALEREVREFLQLALHHDGSGLALHRLDAEQDWNGAGARGAVEHDVDPFAARDLLDALERILLLHIDDVVRAQLLRHLQARAILGRARDDDERGAGLLADDGLREALLPRALDQHGGVVAHAAVEERPLDAVRHRRYQPREFRAHAFRHVVHHRVPRQVYILCEAAPEMRRALGRGVAVADALGIVAPVGVLAVAVLAGVAPLALAAHDVVLDEDQVAFLEAFPAGEFTPGLGDDADVLVAHDHRRRRGRRLVELDVGAADAGDLHLHERAVRRDLRHRKFADLGLAGPRAYRGEYFLHNGRVSHACTRKEPQRGRVPGETLDARALRARSRRHPPRVRAGERDAGFSRAAHRDRVLDGGTKALPLPRVQGAGGRRRRGSAARLVQRRARGDARHRLLLLLRLRSAMRNPA